MTKSRECEQCGSVFYKKVTVPKKDWAEKSKFCSRECANKGKDSSHLKKYSFKKGHRQRAILLDEFGFWDNDTAA